MRNPRPLPVAKRRQAEVAAEHFCRALLACTHTRRAIKARFFKVDFFGADVMGKDGRGLTHYVQVTTGYGGRLSSRRHKLAAIPWAASDRVYLLQLRRAEPAPKSRKAQWEFVVQQWFQIQRLWQRWTQAIAVPEPWFRTAGLQECLNPNGSEMNNEERTMNNEQ